LPTSITYSNGKSATYIYDANGNKLKTTYRTSGSTTETSTDYCGNMIYENNVLKQILVDGGYITFSGSTPQYHYYLKDHLGNNRVVCSASGAVEQVNHYYPFGGLFGESTGGDTQRYKYNGKELDRMHGLDWYDYGARHMDGMRFTTIDPLAGDYYSISPYAYCANNPINAIDPDGRDIIIQYKDRHGKFQTFYFCGFGGKTIRIPKNQFVKDVISAYLYNASDGKMNNMIKAATNSKYKIYLRDATDPDVIDRPSNNYIKDGGKHIVTWLSRKGIETTNGGRQSAATGLEHEFDHAVNAIEDPDHRRRVNTYNEQYDTEEEKRVIEGSETKNALLHGETIRKDHKGKYYDAINSISTKNKQ
jgi:RHS repeat-associated protein